MLLPKLRIRLVPDGTISALDRRHVAGFYAGIEAASPDISVVIATLKLSAANPHAKISAAKPRASISATSQLDQHGTTQPVDTTSDFLAVMTWPLICSKANSLNTHPTSSCPSTM